MLLSSHERVMIMCRTKAAFYKAVHAIDRKGR